MSDKKIFISKSQVAEMNEVHGWFQYADAQSDVSNTFANEAIQRYEKIRDAAPLLLEALIELLGNIEDLMDESEGVCGLHLNGDIAPWSELDDGGQFQRFNRTLAHKAIIAATWDSSCAN